MIGVIVALTFGARLLGTEGIRVGDNATLVLGFILLISYLIGSLMPVLKAPRITGYLLCGAFFGPYLLRLLALPQDWALIDLKAIQELELINHVALGLIAFTAGGELRWSRLKRRGRPFLWIALSQSLVTFIGVSLSLYFTAPFIPDLQRYPNSSLWIIAWLLGAICIANSPATAIAVINETRARGKVTDHALGITIVKDVVVVIIFTATMAIARKFVTHIHHTEEQAVIYAIVWEILGSLIAGSLLGILLVLYIKHVKTEFPMVVLSMGFLAVYTSTPLALSGLLLCLTAGFVVENYSIHGQDLIHAVEQYSLPVYIVFFTLAGSTLDLTALRTVGITALIVCGLRLLFTACGTFLGSVASRQDRLIATQSWKAYIGQAGVSLGFALIIREAFPEFGNHLYSIIVATVTINQIAGPIMLHRLLSDAGEIKTYPQIGQESIATNRNPS